LTATAPALADSLQTDAAPDVAGELPLDAAGELPLEAAGELLLDEQAASITTALTARAASVRWDIGISS
jgi:hypothetical protein